MWPIAYWEMTLSKKRSTQTGTWSFIRGVASDAVSNQLLLEGGDGFLQGSESGPAVDLTGPLWLCASLWPLFLSPSCSLSLSPQSPPHLHSYPPTICHSSLASLKARAEIVGTFVVRLGPPSVFFLTWKKTIFLSRKTFLETEKFCEG